MNSQYMIALSAPSLCFFIGALALWLWAKDGKKPAALALALSYFCATVVFGILMMVPLMPERLAALLTGFAPLSSFTFAIFAIQSRLNASKTIYLCFLGLALAIQVAAQTTLGQTIGSAIVGVETINILFYGSGAYLLHKHGRCISDKIAYSFFLFGTLVYIARIAAFSSNLIALPSQETFLEPGYFAFIQLITIVIMIGSGIGLLGGLMEDRMEIKRSEYLTDILSGLPNRQAFMEKANAAILASGNEPHHNQHWLFICDIDHFKKINDVFGHPAGDRVIQQIGQVFQAISGPSAIVGRIGGEEFALLLLGCERPAAKIIAEKLGKAIELISVAHQYFVTASFGGASFTGVSEFSKALKRADVALYQAKDGGRNQAVLFNPEENEATATRFETRSAQSAAA